MFANSLEDIYFNFKVIIISIIVILVFFFIYNTFLVDNTLDSLKDSLEQTEKALNISDLRGLDIPLTQILTKEVSQSKVGAVNFHSLEHARRLAREGENFAQIDDIKLSLKDVVRQKEAKLGALRVICNDLNRHFNKFFVFLSRFFFSIFYWTDYKERIQEADEAVRKAMLLERKGQPEEARKIYSDIIQKYPKYDKIALVNLRLAFVMQQAGDIGGAVKIYEDVVRRHAREKEADVAVTLLTSIGSHASIRKKIDALLDKARAIPDVRTREKQQVLFEVATLYTSIFNMEEAKRYYAQAINLDPKTDLANEARFVLGWVFVETNDLQEATEIYSKMASESVNSSILVSHSMYEMVNIALKQGKFTEAVDMLLKIIDNFPDDPAAASCLFQAASICLHDLKDEERARELFNRLQQTYPKDIYSKSLAPERSMGFMLGYLGPRISQAVTSQSLGMLSLIGFSGNINVAQGRFTDLSATKMFHRILKSVVTRNFGSRFIVKRANVAFLEGRVMVDVILSTGKFDIPALLEFKIFTSAEDTVDFSFTKIKFLGIPVAPFLVNNFVRPSVSVQKNFPFIPTEIVSITGKFSIKGYLSSSLAERFKRIAADYDGIHIDMEDIPLKDISNVYRLFEKRFPYSNFFSGFQYDDETLFLDAFTRMTLYASFRLFENIKDSRMQYESSLMTLGQTVVKFDGFKISYAQEKFNLMLNAFIKNEFPWVIADRFFFDPRLVKVVFIGRDKFSIDATLGASMRNVLRTETQSWHGRNMHFKANCRIVVDEKAKMMRIVFDDARLNDRNFSVDKLNQVTLRGFNLLKDGNLPLTIKSVRTDNAAITFWGDGCRDFAARIFNEENIFSSFAYNQYILRYMDMQKLNGLDDEGRLKFIPGG
jgi:TolA-binding protein